MPGSNYRDWRRMAGIVWPTGTDGILTAGTTFNTSAANVVKNYSSVNLASQTFTVLGGNFLVIGVLGNLNMTGCTWNGNFNNEFTDSGTGTPIAVTKTYTALNGLFYSHTTTSAVGGNGGGDGGFLNAGGSRRYGSGGGGACADPSGGGGSGDAATSTGSGAGGPNTFNSIPGGAAAANGSLANSGADDFNATGCAGSGGGGGSRVASGSRIIFIVYGNIIGWSSNTFIFNGNNGSTGGNGGDATGDPVTGYGGGGGGGSGGGFGGFFKASVHGTGSGLITTGLTLINVTGGTGGSGGAGAIVASGNNGFNGTAGAAGLAGSKSIATY